MSYFVVSQELRFSFIEMDTKLLELLGSNKTYINRREYKLCMTAFLGHMPSEVELEFLFDNRCLIPLSELRNLITRHCHQKTDREFEAMQIFRLFDIEGKGYIGLKDLHRVWKNTTSHLSWRHLSECFREISIGNKLCYDLFKTMYLAEM